jgi:hypothetical protein
VITQEPDGRRIYRWDAKQQAFVSQIKTKPKAKKAKAK